MDLSEDKKACGKCLHCGLVFTYEIPKKIWKEHSNLISLIQLYCSAPCENAERQELEKLRLEREKQKPREREKFCPKCGFVPKTMHQKHRKDCPKCASLYSWRDVKEEVEENEQ